MKKLTLYFSLAFMILLANCGSDKSESEYEQLLKKSDTLEKRNNNLTNALDTLKQSHEQLTQTLQSQTNIDTAWLEKLAGHEVVMKNQKATLDKNKQIFDAHREFKNKRDQVTKEEFQAQLSEMKQGHSEIQNQLDQVKTQQQTMSDEHQSIEKELREKNQEQ